MNKPFLILSLFLSLLCSNLFGQTSLERLGQKAMIGGDFKSAAVYFDKAYTSDIKNMNALWLLGYSYYHDTEYRKCILTFDRLIGLKPTEIVAYYYRGKAKSLLFNAIKEDNSSEKEGLLLSAIKDFTTAIDLSPEDMKLYQNRGLAYQKFGVYKSQKVSSSNKMMVINSLNASIADFQKVLSDNNNRKDILSQIEHSKQVLIDIR